MSVTLNKSSLYLRHLPSSAINPVTSITAEYTCSTGLVTVRWELVFGATSYRATAVDGTGASGNCTSSTSSCQITMLNCGEIYRVTVTTLSDSCENKGNVSATFETGELPHAHMNTTKTLLAYPFLFSPCLFFSFVTFPCCIHFPHAHLLMLPHVSLVTHTHTCFWTYCESLSKTFYESVLWEPVWQYPIVSGDVFSCRALKHTLSLAILSCHPTPADVKLFTFPLK